MPENKQPNLIANLKRQTLVLSTNISSTQEYGEGGYSVLVNYQSLLSNIFPLTLPPIIFLIKYRRNRLLRVSFIE